MKKKSIILLLVASFIVLQCGSSWELVTENKAGSNENNLFGFGIGQSKDPQFAREKAATSAMGELARNMETYITQLISLDRGEEYTKIHVQDIGRVTGVSERIIKTPTLLLDKYRKTKNGYEAVIRYQIDKEKALESMQEVTNNINLNSNFRKDLDEISEKEINKLKVYRGY